MKKIPFLLVALFAFQVEASDTLRLSIGDPARKDRTVSLTLDALTDASTGEIIDLTALPEKLTGVNLFLVGENHTSSEVHQVQRKVLEMLIDSGRRVLLGLEMYPYTEQKHLDQWSRGLLTEEGFVELSQWYRNWGYNWNYYRDILLLARQHRLPVYAINIPRPIVTAVRRKGFEGLSEEERVHLPGEIDTDDEDHYRLFKAFLGGDESFHASLSDEQLRGMFNAQCTWDAAMAHHAVRALERHSGEDPIMMVLVGSGHVAYGLGIQRQASQMFSGGTAALIPLPVRDEEGERVAEVQASFAEFVWGVPAEAFTRYPSLGASASTDKESGRQKVLFVQKGSAAQQAGLQKDDLLKSMDGREITNRAALNELIASKEWGDSSRLVVIREGEEQMLTVHFRRELEEDEKEKKEEPH